MRKATVLFITLLLSQLFFAQKIYWNESRKLTWDDFQAKKNLGGNPLTVAFAYCGLQYHVKRSTNPKYPVSIDIKSSFIVDKSWKKSDSVTAEVLKHEQNHFDITEIYARKLRKFVKEKIKTSGDYDRYFKKGYQKIYDEYRAFQETYDRETQNSINKEKQKFYNELVAQLLNDLKAYQ